MLCAPAVAAPANGQLAAVADGRLVALNPDGSGLRTLPVADPQSITELAWSPGGNRLAFVKAGDIGVLELATGRVVSVTSGDDDDANIGWSSDGTQIGFRRGPATMTVPAAGGEALPYGLALPEGITQIAWEPNLQGLAMVVGDLLLVPLFKTPPLVIGAPAWSPDGATIAFANADGLATIAAAGGDSAPVTTGPVGPPRWSPDSRALVYSAGTELRTVALDGGAPQVVLTRAGRRCRGLAALHGRHRDLRLRRPAALQRDGRDGDDPGRSARRPAGRRRARTRPAGRCRSSSSRPRSTAR